MMDLNKLYEWCRIPMEELLDHKDRKVPLRIVEDAAQLGEVMARDLAGEEIKAINLEQRPFRLIVPCGPKEWYAPFARMVNEERISLKNMICFHMDENLDWEGKTAAQKGSQQFQDIYAYLFL